DDRQRAPAGQAQGDHAPALASGSAVTIPRPAAYLFVYEAVDPRRVDRTRRVRQRVGGTTADRLGGSACASGASAADPGADGCPAFHVGRAFTSAQPSLER